MNDEIQGEGDYEAAERFNKAEQDFIKNKLRKQKKVRMPTGSPDEDGDGDMGRDRQTDAAAIERDDAELLKRFGIEVPRRVE